MSKKKNTLQDLDDFLKQQAATLVTPESLPASIAPHQEKETLSIPVDGRNLSAAFNESPDNDPAFRTKLYDFIIQTLEAQKESLPEDKMLINTALYLKNGTDWKSRIRQYWKDH